jgi:hypothetical protein
MDEYGYDHNFLEMARLFVRVAQLPVFSRQCSTG